MKTQLDVYESATRAARATLDETLAYKVESGALEAFNGDSQDPEDWPQWRDWFHDRRNYFISLKGKKAASEALAGSQEQKG